MIIAKTFSSDDLRRVVARDDVESTDWFNRKVRMIQRESLKARKFPFGCYVTYTTKDKNKYVLCFNVYGKRRFKFGMFLVGMSDKGVCYYIVSQTNLNQSKYINVYTLHFLRRYRERMGLKDTDEALLMMYFWRNDANVIIYHDKQEHKMVYATKDGISLVSQDDKRYLMWFNTFISNDMLFTSQRRAKQKVMDIIEESKFPQETNRDEYEAKKRLYDIAVKSLYSQTSKIYQNYFNKKNERKEI